MKIRRKILSFYFSCFILTGLIITCGERQTSPQSSLQMLSSTKNPGISSRRVGEMEGYSSINEKLRQRLFDIDDKNTRQFSIESIGGIGVYQMRKLLGTYSEGSPTHRFQNGEPNPFNTMLWHHQLSTLARGFSRLCEIQNRDNVEFTVIDREVSFALHPNLRAMMPALCAGSPSFTAREFWEQLMHYEAPHSEQEAWLHFVDHELAAQKDTLERVQETFTTVLLNPYLLLQE